MKWVVLAFTLALAACGGPMPESAPTEHKIGDMRGYTVSRFHDDEKGVTCWVITGNGPGISCLPDSQLKDR